MNTKLKFFIVLFFCLYFINIDINFASAETDPVLLKDIYVGPSSSDPSNIINIDGILYFSATDATYGTELWRSNGTEDGTYMIKDIRSGINSSSPSNLTNVNGTLFFSATNGTNGVELWKSDGTADSTIIVKDINSGSSNSNPSNLTNVNGTLFFSAYDATNGTELWKSNGTGAGTVLVTNIAEGVFSSNIAYITNINGVAFFVANNNGTNGVELWKSDGTEAGTEMVKDIYDGSNSSSPSGLINVNGVLYFRANNGTNGVELWKSDGTALNTVMVNDIWSGVDNSVPTDLMNLDGTIYFRANNGTNGVELWKSNGTASGTVMVKDIYPGDSNRHSNPSNFTDVGGVLYFRANDGTHYNELWKSDGTASGTVMVKDINTTASLESVPSYLTVLNGALYFSANDGINGNELWMLLTDITAPNITGLTSTTIPVQSKTWNWGSDDATATFRYSVTTSSSFVFTTETYGATTTASQTTGNGTYYLFVEAKDLSGNTSTTSVSAVLDNTSPEITILGDNPISINQYSIYLDDGATSTDNIDLDLTSSITTTNSVNTSTLGVYTVLYEVSDTAGNSASSTRIVNVVDTTAPNITGLTSTTIPVQSKTWNWGSDDATATFRYSVTTSPSFVFTTETYGATTTISQTSGNGTYYLFVEAKDENNNTSTTSVSAVLDNTAPTISLVGDNVISISYGSVYTDLGATATDNIDVSATVLTTGTVDTLIPGTYTLTYTSQDTALNSSMITRVVTVLQMPGGGLSPAVLNTMNQNAIINYTAINSPLTLKSSNQSGVINKTLSNLLIKAVVSKGTVGTQTEFDIVSVDISKIRLPMSIQKPTGLFRLRVTVSDNKNIASSFIKPVQIIQDVLEDALVDGINPYILEEGSDEWQLIPGAIINQDNNTISYNITSGGDVALFKSKEKKLTLGEKIVNNICNTNTFKRYLYIGSKGDDVKKLQEILKKLGYFKYNTITTYFGSNTKKAVIEYQKANVLKPYPGWVGPETRQFLNKEICK